MLQDKKWYIPNDPLIRVLHFRALQGTNHLNTHRKANCDKSDGTATGSLVRVGGAGAKVAKRLLVQIWAGEGGVRSIA